MVKDDENSISGEIRQEEKIFAYFFFFFGALRRVRYFAVGSLTLPGSWLFNAS
jgi:hypothetical protein